MLLEIATPAAIPEDLDLSRLRQALNGEFGSTVSGTISLALVDNATIRDMNTRFLGHTDVTDVLAFPLAEDEASSEPESAIGEIVVSLDVAAAEARARGIPIQEEVLRYCVHGFLHLLGHDDRTAKDAARMRRKQEQIVRRHTNPSIPPWPS